jgi:hypothetical protein
VSRRLLLAVVCVCLLAACGHPSPPSPVLTTSPVAAPRSSTGAATAPTAVLGCGTYCQQAGDSAGTAPPGYPCPKGGCLRCPPQNCVTLESSGATATNGVLTVKLRCNLSTACHGAFLLCMPLFTCWNGPTESGAGGRLAGSDFVLPPGAIRDVGVTLTPLARQVVSDQEPRGADVLVDLLDYGIVIGNDSRTGNFSLASTDPPAYPAGSTSRCGTFLFVGPDASCPFAKSVEKAYANGNGYEADKKVRAFSPVTGKSYVMRCVGKSPHVCRGGINALVVFYD